MTRKEKNNKKRLTGGVLVSLISYSVFASLGTTILNISAYLDNPFLGKGLNTLKYLFIVFMVMNLAIYFFIPYFLNYLLNNK